MDSLLLPQIEKSIIQLPLDEQLWLIGRLVNRIRENTFGQDVFEDQLAAMAADPEIQGELQKIDEEFAFAEADGLEVV